MNALEVKIFLMKRGLTIAGISRDICLEVKAKEKSLQTMISDMIYGRRFYPELAKKLNKKYGLQFERPAQYESARSIIQKSNKY